MELTLIKTYHAVYQRHVDMLTKIPRQPFLIPLDTSDVWFLTRNNTNIQGQIYKITEDLSSIIMILLTLADLSVWPNTKVRN